METLAAALVSLDDLRASLFIGGAVSRLPLFLGIRNAWEHRDRRRFRVPGRG